MSPTGTISVLPAAFASAGQTCGTARDTAAGIITTLAKSLDDNWGCAGTDTTGQSFAGQYDPAAFNAVQSGADIVNGLGQLHDLLQYTSVNHANANTQAAVGAKPGDVTNPPALTAHYDTPKFKGSYGGDSDAPFGWSLITRWLQGRTWPNGHQDKLDKLNDAWDTAANGLEAIVKGLQGVRGIVDEQISDEVPQILAQIDLVIGDITSAANQYRSLGTACTQYADALTTAHDAIGKALAEVIIVAGLGAIVGSVIGPEGTAGGGALAAGAGGEIAGAEVVTAIDALVQAITPVRAALAAVGVAAGPITQNLQPLLEAKPTQFNANTRPGGNPIAPKPYRPKDETGDFNGEQAAQDARADLTAQGQQPKLGKNVAVGEAEIDGQFLPSSELRAVSGQDPAPPGTIGEPSNPVFQPIDSTGTVQRPTDSEYKILENLATKLKPDSTGVINLYTEAEPCPACKSVIEQFEDRYPGVTLNVTHSIDSPK